jgi:3',5'-nucleoside bisphosphate phosphatase
VALRFDLQSHSTASDGSLPPAQVVANAANAGVELLALSDHDTIGGVADAIDAGAQLGVKIVPAVEISAVDDGAGGDREGAGDRDGVGDRDGAGGDRESASLVARELHILGYDVDHTGPPLTERLVDFLADREKRTLRMRDALRDVGFELDEAEIEQRIADGKPIGRPHLAGAVLSAPANAQRLDDEQIDDIGSLIRSYLIDGKPAFRLRETPTVAEAIGAIHEAGGVAVWAHPFWDVDADDEVFASIDRFRALGVDGVEAFYITHDERQTRLLAARCDELGLLSTGSADYHGPDNRLFSQFLAFETYDLQPNLGPIG